MATLVVRRPWAITREIPELGAQIPDAQVPILTAVAYAQKAARRLGSVAFEGLKFVLNPTVWEIVVI
jgi:hypothetical protein